MGGARSERKQLTCPRGVTIRQFAKEQRIQVAFSFRQTQCRELLPPQPITQTALQLAGGLRAEIQRKIAEGKFVYADYFPLCERAGVRYRNPYQVRHTYASTLLTANENPWYVAQQLGHVDVEMVYRIYGKFISQDYQRPKANSAAEREA